MQAEIVEDGDDIGGAQGQIVGGAIVRLVALAVAAGVDQDHGVPIPQGLDIAEVHPIRAAAHRAVVKHERRSAAGGLVMDADAAVAREWHGFSPEQ